MKIICPQDHKDYWHHVYGYQDTDLLEKSYTVHAPQVVDINQAFKQHSTPLTPSEQDQLFHFLITQIPRCQWGKKYYDARDFLTTADFIFYLRGGFLVVGDLMYPVMELEQHSRSKSPTSTPTPSRQLFNHPLKALESLVEGSHKNHDQYQQALRQFSMMTAHIKSNGELKMNPPVPQAQWDELFQPQPTPGSLRSWMIEHQCPLLFMGQQRFSFFDFLNLKSQSFKLELNPYLKHLGVQKWLEPHVVYQHVSMMVDGCFSTPEPSSTMSNQEKIVSHGFDLKASFRHRSS